LGNAALQYNFGGTGTGPGCTETTISDDDFENNWGIWNDGGSDARRNIKDATYANSGSFCFRLRDNTETSTATTDVLDLSTYEQINISFSYITNSMDNTNEDFWLQLSTDGGATYNTISEWNLNDEFENNVRQNEQVEINGPFSNNSKLRFRCDASGNADWVYIDDVIISGCTTTTQLTKTTSKTKSFTNDLEPQLSLNNLKVYPNPAKDVLNIECYLESNKFVTIEIYGIDGKRYHTNKLETRKGNNKQNINISSLRTGLYILKISIDSKTLFKKILIK